jgi:hypothetical protein
MTTETQILTNHLWRRQAVLNLGHFPFEIVPPGIPWWISDSCPEPSRRIGIRISDFKLATRPQSPKRPLPCSPVPLLYSMVSPQPLYVCRDFSTNPPLSAQNKPNSSKDKTNATSVTPKSYTNIPFRSAPKNKPNQTQSRRAGSPPRYAIRNTRYAIRNTNPVKPNSPRKARFFSFCSVFPTSLLRMAVGPAPRAPPS